MTLWRCPWTEYIGQCWSPKVQRHQKKDLKATPLQDLWVRVFHACYKQDTGLSLLPYFYRWDNQVTVGLINLLQDFTADVNSASCVFFISTSISTNLYTTKNTNINQFPRIDDFKQKEPLLNFSFLNIKNRFYHTIHPNHSVPSLHSSPAPLSQKSTSLFPL